MEISREMPKFDRRTREGRYLSDFEQLMQLTYAGKLDKKLTREDVPRDFPFLMASEIPEGGWWKITESNDDEDVNSLRIIVYEPKDIISDIKEYGVPLAFQNFFAEKKRQANEARMRAQDSFVRFARGNLNRRLTPEDWEQYGKSWYERVWDRSASEFPQISYWTIIPAPENRLRVELYDENGDYIDVLEFETASTK